MQKQVYTDWIKEVFKANSSKLKDDLFKEFRSGSKLLLLLEKLLRKPTDAAFKRASNIDDIRTALDFLKIPCTVISPDEILTGNESKTLQLISIIIEKVNVRKIIL